MADIKSHMVQTLWRDALAEETRLRDLEGRIRAQSQSTGKKAPAPPDDPLLAQLNESRVVLESLYEDLILSDPHGAEAKNVEERLWAAVFYQRVEELRAVNRNKPQIPNAPSNTLLLAHIDHATFFYQSLIQSVRLRAGLDGGMEALCTVGVARWSERAGLQRQQPEQVEDLFKGPQSPSKQADLVPGSGVGHMLQSPAKQGPTSVGGTARSTGTGAASPMKAPPTTIMARKTRDPLQSALDTVHRTLIYLGDLARYRHLLLPPSLQTWYPPRALYRRALLVMPGSSKACAQLGIVAGYYNDDLDVAYWNGLSSTMLNSVSQGKENLNAFYLSHGEEIIGKANGE
ncbi:Smg-6, nonsense mediated mRNA decay factor [Gonapodya sp. JEL0774]|nr:Smg-6, nonsense mediated mRNA decay factor [Gonapodya sp. JEL0774]